MALRPTVRSMSTGCFATTTSRRSSTARPRTSSIKAWMLTDSRSASTGYNYKVPNSSWFVEPSLGVVWSREQIDPFNAASPLASRMTRSSRGNFSGTTQVNDISPFSGGPAFASARRSSRATSCSSRSLPRASGTTSAATSLRLTALATLHLHRRGPGSLTATSSTNNIGTFGQYSVGVAGQLTGTGWLGFARADFREGPNMSGLSGTGGIRYQFTPGAAPADAGQGAARSRADQLGRSLRRCHRRC